VLAGVVQVKTNDSNQGKDSLLKHNEERKPGKCQQLLAAEPLLLQLLVSGMDCLITSSWLMTVNFSTTLKTSFLSQ